MVSILPMGPYILAVEIIPCLGLGQIITFSDGHVPGLQNLLYVRLVSAGHGTRERRSREDNLLI